MDVYAYELLFRNGNNNSANIVNGEEATSQVMGNSLAEVGLETGDALSNEFFSTGFDQINDLYLQAMQFADKSAVNLN